MYDGHLYYIKLEMNSIHQKYIPKYSKITKRIFIFINVHYQEPLEL